MKRCFAFVLFIALAGLALLRPGWVSGIDSSSSSTVAYVPLVAREPMPTPMPSPTPIVVPPPPPVPIVNGSFESGSVGWREISRRGNRLIVDYIELGIPPYDGDWAARLGDYYERASIQQQIYVPLSQPYLRFHFRINSEEIFCNKDVAGASLDGVSVETIPLCQVNNNQGRWYAWALDLSDYRGRHALLEFTIVTDGLPGSTIYIDRVYFSDSPGRREEVELLLDGDEQFLRE
jgi:hypothetical protein